MCVWDRVAQNSVTLFWMVFVWCDASKLFVEVRFLLTFQSFVVVEFGYIRTLGSARSDFFEELIWIKWKLVTKPSAICVNRQNEDTFGFFFSFVCWLLIGTFLHKWLVYFFFDVFFDIVSTDYFWRQTKNIINWNIFSDTTSFSCFFVYSIQFNQKSSNHYYWIKKSNQRVKDLQWTLIINRI